MAGVNVQKNYLSVNINSTNLANNWSVLVYGVTERGTTRPTLVQSYDAFTANFGQPVPNVLTHAYMRFLLDNGVPVLFKRVIDSKQLVAASALVSNTKDENLFSIQATDAFIGTAGNKIAFNIVKNIVTSACSFQVLYNSQVVESFNLGQDITGEVGELVYSFINSAANSTTPVSDYVTFQVINNDVTAWNATFPLAEPVNLEGGAEPANNKASALALMSDITSEVYTDARLLQALTYYPELRFVTTGGICDSDVTKQEVILENLGQFCVNCKTAFRVLIDYALEMTNISTVRNFVRSIATKGNVSTSIYAYFGFWGADNNNNYLPGSAGFLTAIARSGYNVYSRRIAGTSFTPAFTKPYKEIYVDALNDWQAEDAIQLNPITIVDAQDNIAIMGSSTLAMPTNINTRNPAQALDVVLVGDYVAALLHGIALNYLKVPLDRLNLSALSKSMDGVIYKFVESRAITHYDLIFDTTTLGKLGVYCTLYFAIGLEEVSITVTSTYDTEILG